MNAMTAVTDVLIRPGAQRQTASEITSATSEPTSICPVCGSPADSNAS
jgi:hypothetical protein